MALEKRTVNFKLFKDGKLDLEKFAEFFQKIEWYKREVKQHKNLVTFYIGKYQEESFNISVNIGPGLKTSITETQYYVNDMGGDYYQLFSEDGKIVKREDRNHGNASCYERINVTQNVIDKLQVIAKEKPKQPKKVFDLEI
jgi:hypothetical protein